MLFTKVLSFVTDKNIIVLWCLRAIGPGSLPIIAVDSQMPKSHIRCCVFVQDLCILLLCFKSPPGYSPPNTTQCHIDGCFAWRIIPRTILSVKHRLESLLKCSVREVEFTEQVWGTPRGHCSPLPWVTAVLSWPFLKCPFPVEMCWVKQVTFWVEGKVNSLP